jgi:transposase
MQVYIGIDWSESKHDVVAMNAAGAVLAQLTIPHSIEGFLQLTDLQEKLGMNSEDCLVGLETAHNLIIDFLWSRGFGQVFVVPPRVVKSSRTRFRHSAARTDLSDALVIADCLRTDRGRMQPWHPDSLLTQQIRAKVSLIHHLTRGVGRLYNRLRDVLLRYYPAALDVFGNQSKVWLAFICAYGSPEKAQKLTFEDFRLFARQHRYPNPALLPAAFARLQAPQPVASATIVMVYEDEAHTLARLLLEMKMSKEKALKELKNLFDQHPDAPIFDSLPGAGDLLAPALLAKFGDDRDRFTSPASVQALAGTCPVTDASGKRRVIKFRRACDREFRRITQQWAKASLGKSVWANAYWLKVYSRRGYASHAYRCLANRWLAILWRIWQDGVIYDETYHLQQRAMHSKACN